MELVDNSLELRSKITEILYDVNKPSRYIGKEIGCANKIWEDAKVKTAIAFHDLYEIGVSNLGHRLLYNLINEYKNENFLADRVYAPAIDFKKKLEENNLPLYCVESFKPLIEFDIIAFSLQYELSYPTILAMLDLSKIPVKSIDRNEKHPLIIAGGPGSYNPEPIADFIDVFIVGDGEEVLIEILECIKTCKNAQLSKKETLIELAKLKGIYVPQFYEVKDGISQPVDERFANFIEKRISSLEIDSYPVKFPVPYASAVHDRAVIEIRRGCARMCRFCQSCFVNLPVREKSPEKILNLTDEVLKNTGYEEYSLLSLSSSDYKDIKTLVCELNNQHSQNYTSISLPSQRADIFDPELAEQVQSVRKSTITLAPEAGTQRLRDAINKNLTEEHILNAVFSAYKAGWKKVKLYFMIGLPTETYEDLDGILNLLQKIKNQSLDIRREFNLKHFLDITCTMSIFVPKPFTPFQWCSQDSLDTINKKIRYLKENARKIRGIRLNFHDSFLCQLETVFSRGDRTLNKVLETAWKMGSYLDAWEEHFNKEIWYKSAELCEINFEKLATEKLGLDKNLPWDIINVGVEKNWLKNEYNISTLNKTTVPCDETCAKCGVCKNLKTKPDIKSKPLVISKKPEKILDLKNMDVTYKYRLKLLKKDELKFISHLDFQSLFYKAARKAQLKFAYSQGFNPSPKISLGIALPLFVESVCEYIDLELTENMNTDLLKEKLNDNLPQNAQILKVVKIDSSTKSVDRSLNWAVYIANPITFLNSSEIEAVINDFEQKEDFTIEKIGKKGKTRVVNVKNSVYSIKYQNGKLHFILKAGQHAEGDSKEVPSLRPDAFLNCIFPNTKWLITREQLLDNDFKELL
ncbi:MAG: TIGR03960 family B12-binding radical SAM protein [Candidatus Gastranaerophilales bacterium]|nr:TIGR03960 family B12-binding radical SAM protein [Candidatus Gastranaerophilales bacterium]